MKGVPFMANKFGKFVFASAAIAGAAAAFAYLYTQKKESETILLSDELESEDNAEENISRNYVPLTKPGFADEVSELTEDDEKAFTPLSETLAAKVQAEEVPESVEEFFDAQDTAETVVETIEESTEE